jgi:hypothetical protein
MTQFHNQSAVVFYQEQSSKKRTPSWRGAERRGHPEKIFCWIATRLTALAMTIEGVASQVFNLHVGCKIV